MMRKLIGITLALILLILLFINVSGPNAPLKFENNISEIILYMEKSISPW